MNKYLSFIALLFFSFNSYAQISTPGTGVSWNIDSLINAYPDVVLENAAENTYVILADLHVSPLDTLVLKGFTLGVKDTVQLASLEATIYFDDIQFQGIENDTFQRMRFDLSEVYITSCTFLKGGGISFIDSEYAIDSSAFIETLSLEAGVGSAVSPFRSTGTIRNSTFRETESAAISSGINAAASIVVDNCLFIENNTLNKNTPQINFAESAEGDSIVITNCEIHGKYDKCGGIAVANFLSTETKVIIEGNLIKDNRYGITMLGSNIVSSIQNNVIIGNNIEGAPMLGGSGINLLGDESNVAYIGGNHIEDNLWGLTIQAADADEFIAPLPYLSEPDGRILPYPTTQNAFVDNQNSGQIYAIYNMNDDTIYARQNYWNTTDPEEIEDAIYHEYDDADLGPVIYDDFLLVHPDSTSVSVFNPELKDLNIFPNPARVGEDVKIQSQLGAGTLRIYNNSGEIVKIHHYESQPTSFKANLLAGTYHMVFNAESGDRFKGKIILID